MDTWQPMINSAWYTPGSPPLGWLCLIG